MGIYLDNAATTRLLPEVFDAMRPWLQENYGNAASVYYGLGREASLAVESAREKVAELVGASAEEIYFTASATEANNWVLHESAWANPKKTHIVTSKIEHHAVLEPLNLLEKRFGRTITRVAPDFFGHITPEVLEESLREDTAVVSLMLANNEVGTLNDVKTLAGRAREKGIRFHTDATQAVGKIPVDVEELGVDFLSLSAHKFYGPKGVGALYIRKGTRLSAFMHGGSQERGRRAGTTNTAGCVGLGTAAELAVARIKEGKEARCESELVETLWNSIVDIPKIFRNGNPDPQKRMPNILSVCVEGAEGEAILGYMDQRGIQVSSGSACTSGSLEPSHVLTAMGVPVELAHGSIRFSLSGEITRADITETANAFREVIERTRAMSVTWKG